MLIRVLSIQANDRTFAVHAHHGLLLAALPQIPFTRISGSKKFQVRIHSRGWCNGYVWRRVSCSPATPTGAVCA